MASISVGPLTLQTNQIGWSPAEASSFSGGKAQGLSYPAVVTGPNRLEIDLAIFMSDDGNGMVHCPDSAGVPADYARLARGARLGVYEHDESTWVIKQLRLLQFSSGSGWGNLRMATLDELDQLLGSSVSTLLEDLGLEEIGTKSEVLQTNGNDLALLWGSDSGPDLPLTCYTLTRILPIFKALSS